jgi:hypothetical protein
MMPQYNSTGVRSQLGDAGRHDPIPSLEHLDGTAGVAAFVAIPQVRAPEIRQHDEGGDGDDQPGLFEALDEHNDPP